MRYEIIQSQLAYFEKHKILTLEEAYTGFICPKRGYDVWRTHPDIKQIIAHRNVGELIYQLTHIRPVRLLFDRAVSNETIDLTETSFQGVIIGALFTETTLTFFSNLIAVTEPSLLVVYGEIKSVYICNKHDPYAGYPKQQGYNYGDALNPNDYPLIYR